MAEDEKEEAERQLREMLYGEDCRLCGAGPTGRCTLPEQFESCPYGCSPER